MAHLSNLSVLQERRAIHHGSITLRIRRRARIRYLESIALVRVDDDLVSVAVSVLDTLLSPVQEILRRVTVCGRVSESQRLSVYFQGQVRVFSVVNNTCSSAAGTNLDGGNEVVREEGNGSVLDGGVLGRGEGTDAEEEVAPPQFAREHTTHSSARVSDGVYEDYGSEASRGERDYEHGGERSVGATVCSVAGGEFVYA